MPVETPVMKVTCDFCGNSDEIELEYRYTSYYGSSGSYDWAETVEIARESGWDIKDDDAKVFCCPKCGHFGECKECGGLSDLNVETDRCKDCAMICGDCGESSEQLNDDDLCPNCVEECGDKWHDARSGSERAPTCPTCDVEGED